jgi:hypothetical protein
VDRDNNVAALAVVPACAYSYIQCGRTRSAFGGVNRWLITSAASVVHEHVAVVEIDGERDELASSSGE